MFPTCAEHWLREGLQMLPASLQLQLGLAYSMKINVNLLKLVGFFLIWAREESSYGWKEEGESSYAWI